MYTYKVMIHPNNKQETKIRRTLNKCIECNNIVYDYIDGFMKNNLPIPKCKEVRKWFTIQKGILDSETISSRAKMSKKEIIANHLDTLFYDVSNDALKQEIKDTYNSFIRFFKKLGDYPKNKKYSAYRKSFYVDPYKIEFTSNKVKLEKITSSLRENRRIINYISLAEKDRIPLDTKYYNPRVILENNKFYIVVATEDAPLKDKNVIPINDNIIGIDLNVAEIVTSDDDRFTSVTKNKRYINANKKYKRAQRKLSKKYEVAKENKKKVKECKNYQKQKKIKQKYQQRLNNLKLAHDSMIITTLINKRPKCIKVEDLDIKAMQESEEKESKYIRKAIQKNGWGIFIKRLKEECEKHSIELFKINRWYPSSKRCHLCGNIKKDLLLSDRTYICEACGLKINRDLNAAINIKNFTI